MHIFEVIILGLVQGLTEFLPISSSAHLRIVGEFLPSQTDPGATFTAITQIGTELAVLIYFRKKIARVISRCFLSLSGQGAAQRPRRPHGLARHHRQRSPSLCSASCCRASSATTSGACGSPPWC